MTKIPPAALSNSSLATPDPDRAALRHDMKCAVRQFLLDGGTIEEVPQGASGRDYGKRNGTSHLHLSRAAREAADTPVKDPIDPAEAALARRIERAAARKAGLPTVLSAGGRGSRSRNEGDWRRAAFAAMHMADLKAPAVARGLRIETSRAYGYLYQAKVDDRGFIVERAGTLLAGARGA